MWSCCPHASAYSTPKLMSPRPTSFKNLASCVSEITSTLRGSYLQRQPQTRCHDSRSCDTAAVSRVNVLVEYQPRFCIKLSFCQGDSWQLGASRRGFRVTRMAEAHRTKLAK